MAVSDERINRDLILSPNTYAYMRDTASGIIKVAAGPCVINLTAQEQPVVYDPEVAQFKSGTLDAVAKKSIIAPEGFYVILLNPALSENLPHPVSGKTQPSTELVVGRKIIIPGPAMFPLWPGQDADVVRGHQLKFNEYLIVRVYNEEQATKNWKSAVMKPANLLIDSTEAPQPSSAPPNLTVGTRLIIRGDQVSFYMPPTGITVQEVDGKYVQDALTLERLEYAILIGQDGNKRYENGPKVVFPAPTERFATGKDDDGKETTKFRAIELNPLQGLHIKVIADYDENGKKYTAGEELFITGKDTSIYYPREVHSAIKYDGKAKHFATAIPAGEARYVMNRITGEIKTVKGPFMLLPDPRTEVIVRRTLTELQAAFWYPGNEEVSTYNRELRQLLGSVPTTRQGVISEGDYLRSSQTKGVRSRGGDLLASVEKTSGSGMLGAASAKMDSSRVSGDQNLVGTEFSRSSTYSQPRTIDLNTKFQGAPRIRVYTGFAVQVVSTSGDRHVVKGPQTVLLDYDQELETLTLSQGKPKTTDKLLPTVYLRVDNNKVSDIVEVETSDNVKIKLHLSYNINFEGDSGKWFSVENYVQFACHHIRSMLQGAIKKLKFDEFYNTSRDVIRDVILGKSTRSDTTGLPVESKRSGMLFPENGMKVGEVDITGVEILDQQIREMISASQKEAVRSNIDLASKIRELDSLEKRQKIEQTVIRVNAETVKIKDLLSIELLNSKLSVQIAEFNRELKVHENDKLLKTTLEEVTNISHKAHLDRLSSEADLKHSQDEATQELRLEMLDAQTKAIVAQFTAAIPGFAEALVALSNKDTMVQVAKAWSIQTAIGGESISDALSRIFKGSPLQGLTEKIVAMATNGSSLVPSSSTASSS